MLFLRRTFIIVALPTFLLLSIQCNREVTGSGSVLENRNSGKRIKMKLDPVYFNFYKTVITSDAMTQLFSVGYLLTANENYILEIEGHSDDGASEQYEKWLAAERAKVVYDWLVHYGPFSINEKRIIIKNTYEKNQPHSTCGNDEQCHAKNRRVDFMVTNYK
jgi:outer membrane protein OmpA-like peptidoglycan-associated protein